MARISRSEVTRRTAIPERQTEAPQLTVQADMNHTQAAGSLSKVAAGVLGKVAERVQQAKFRKDDQMYEEASLQRMQEDAEGVDRQTEDFVQQQSRAWRQGYLKADGILRVRDWQIEMAKAMAEAEPGEDIEPLIAEGMAALTQNPEFQDPQVRAALIPIAQKAADQVRLKHLQDTMQESLLRQQESLTAIIRDGIKGGALLTDEGMAGMYAMLEQEEYAYLSKRDVDGLFASAAAEALAAGEGDPAAIVEFLESRTDEDGVSLMDGKHGEGLRKAAAAGEAVIQKRADEARAQQLADLEWTLTSLVDQARLTQPVIDRYAEQVGLQGDELRTFRRYWNGQQEAEVRRREAAAKERQTENRAAVLFTQGRFYEMTDDQIRKQYDEMIFRAKTPEERQAILKHSATVTGVAPTYYRNIFRRADWSTAGEEFEPAVEAWRDLYQVSPKFAMETAGAEAAAKLMTYEQRVFNEGANPQTVLGAWRATPLQREDAEVAVRSKWKDISAEYAEVDGQPRTELELHRAERRATEIMALSPGVDPEQAIRAAFGEQDASVTQVNGRRVPRRGMPKGAEGAVERLVGEIAEKLNLPKDELSAFPNRDYPDQWMVVDKFNVPVRDPDTKGRILFSPRAIAPALSTYEADRAEAEARRRSSQGTYAQRQNAAAVAQEARKARETLPPGATAPGAAPLYQLDLEALTPTSETATTPEVPATFLEYLQRSK